MTTGQSKYDEFLATGQSRYDELVTEARERSTGMVHEAQQKKAQILGELSAAKADLERRIGELRNYEKDYRGRLRSFIAEQLDTLDHTAVEPVAEPAAEGDEGGQG